MSNRPFGATPELATPLYQTINHVPVDLALKLRKPVSRYFKTPTAIVNIARMSDHQFSDIIRFAPGDDQRYHAFAMIMQDGLIGNALTYNITALIDGNHHPAIRAAQFIDWGYSFFLRQYNIIHTIVAFWQDKPGQTNMEQYKEGLRMHRGDRVKAVRETWSAKQFSRLGYLFPSLIAEATPEDVQRLLGMESDCNVVMVNFQREIQPNPMILKSTWGELLSKG